MAFRSSGRSGLRRKHTDERHTLIVRLGHSAGLAPFAALARKSTRMYDDDDSPVEPPAARPAAAKPTATAARTLLGTPTPSEPKATLAGSSRIRHPVVMGCWYPPGRGW